jgi:hypothetical protein
MDEEIAKLVIAIGFFIGLAFWLIALQLYRKMASAEPLQRFDARIPDKTPTEVIKDLLSEGKQLLSDGRVFYSQPRVSRPADNRLVVEHGSVEVRFEATRAGGGTLLIAEVDDAGYTRKFQLGLGAFVLILMPLVIGGTVVAMWNFVAPSAAPAVRWQSLQVAQIVHVLWPPFLIYSLWKRVRTQIANSVANLLVFAQAGARATERPFA